jgi:tetratricopeptide (TPR) repeat protein
MAVSFVILLLMTAICEASNDGQPYAGPEVCWGCHNDIAATQAETAMAETWHGILPTTMGAEFKVQTTEAGAPEVVSQVQRSGDRLRYSSTLPNGANMVLPVETVVGGQRNGLSFLERIDRVNGIPLERPALLEGRYAYHEHRLVLSPGFDAAKTTTFEDAFGRALSPTFEQKCLTCHGEPHTLGAGAEGGVRCESCHGPASGHVASFTAPTRQQAKVTPQKLTRFNSLSVCAQCHTGLSDRSDPIPDDLLVSSQAPALSNSECFIQSGGDVTCIDCHNPHRDGSQVAQTSVTTCLRCHSGSIQQHASLCPVNAASGCIGCHMPVVSRNAFHLTDHWIRVHPEQITQPAKHDDSRRSRVPPRREALRILVAENRDNAETAQQRLEKGDPFTQVAHDLSIEPTASGGGYIGEMDLSQMESKLALAASALQYGETSGIVDLNGRWVILHRMPRDFKWHATQLFQEATALKMRGDLKGAVERDRQALELYPYFLRALVFMGTSLGESGEVQRATGVLRFAVRSYPKDPSAQFDLALTLGHQPSEQIAAFQRALDLDPDMIAVYESLGAALYAAGQPDEAIEAFRKGLQVNPLSAFLYYDLGLALTKNGNETDAARALALAKAIDPAIDRKNSK